MHAFDVLGDPVRRRILELLAGGEQAAGQVGAVVQEEFGISQPAVSQHLRVLRDNGFTTVRSQGTRRLYAVDPAPLQEVDMWLEAFRRFWTPRLDALGTEIARGKRERRIRQTQEARTAAADADGPAVSTDAAPHTSGPDGGPARPVD
jgi:DNA-binding transcriptional ArsR family regulator